MGNARVETGFAKQRHQYRIGHETVRQGVPRNQRLGALNTIPPYRDAVRFGAGVAAAYPKA